MKPKKKEKDLKNLLFEETEEQKIEREKKDVEKKKKEEENPF